MKSFNKALVKYKRAAEYNSLYVTADYIVATNSVTAVVVSRNRDDVTAALCELCVKSGNFYLQSADKFIAFMDKAGQSPTMSLNKKLDSLVVTYYDDKNNFRGRASFSVMRLSEETAHTRVPNYSYEDVKSRGILLDSYFNTVHAYSIGEGKAIYNVNSLGAYAKGGKFYSYDLNTIYVSGSEYKTKDFGLALDLLLISNEVDHMAIYDDAQVVLSGPYVTVIGTAIALPSYLESAITKLDNIKNVDFKEVSATFGDGLWDRANVILNSSVIRVNIKDGEISLSTGSGSSQWEEGVGSVDMPDMELKARPSIIKRWLSFDKLYLAVSDGEHYVKGVSLNPVDTKNSEGVVVKSLVPGDTFYAGLDSDLTSLYDGDADVSDYIPSNSDDSEVFEKA